MNKINTVEEFNTALDDNNNIYIYSAEWCPDCTVLYKHYDEIEKKYPMFKFNTINIDELKSLCREQKVMGIPVFLKYNNSVEELRVGSGERLSIELIYDFLDKLSNNS